MKGGARVEKGLFCQGVAGAGKTGQQMLLRSEVAATAPRETPHDERSKVIKKVGKPPNAIRDRGLPANKERGAQGKKTPTFRNEGGRETIFQTRWNARGRGIRKNHFASGHDDLI